MDLYKPIFRFLTKLYDVKPSFSLLCKKGDVKLKNQLKIDSGVLDDTNQKGKQKYLKMNMKKK